MTTGRKISEGREAEVYEWGSGAVLKLYRPGFLGYTPERVALASVANDGVAPRVLGLVEADGRQGLVLERLDGTDMLTLLERAPWRLLGLARILAQAQVRINGVHAPAELPDVKVLLAARIEAAVHSAALRDFALEILDRLPTGDRLCHGDFHPGNVVVVSGRAGVIDWGNGARGAPAADHARTLLLLSRAEALPGTSALFRAVMSAGRDVFARAYARAYRRASSDAVAQIRMWTVVHTAARLAEGIAAERPKLLAALNRAHRKSNLKPRPHS
jgi:Ser/Thr protein kinase RdoA (MazF antagonist)